jgi:ATP-binding cassette subfamily A (ABC1) protein 3
MDPVARRALWRIISRIATERKECSIILTTHSMEEVEALCTRIGIMVGGRLRCLGTAQHLKNRHGQGFVTHMTLAAPAPDVIAAVARAIAGAVPRGSGTPPGEIAAVDLAAACTAFGRPWRAAELAATGSGWALAASAAASTTRSVPIDEAAGWMAEEDVVEGVVGFVAGAFPGARLVERQGLAVEFAVPPQPGMPLGAMFARLEGARALGVATYTLGQTTLEQVFNTFAAQQEEETGSVRGFAAAAATHVGGAAAPQITVPSGSVNSEPSPHVAEWSARSR